MTICIGQVYEATADLTLFDVKMYILVHADAKVCLVGFHDGNYWNNGVYVTNPLDITIGEFMQISNGLKSVKCVGNYLSEWLQNSSIGSTSPDKVDVNDYDYAMKSI